jgi:hypothetical protein
VKTLLTGLAIATLIGGAAAAQSYDPDVGSGNIVRPGATNRGLSPGYAPYSSRGAFGAYAWSPARHVGHTRQIRRRRLAR